MPDAAGLAVAFVVLAVLLALAAIRFGMLLGGRLGRRLDHDDEEEPRGPGA